MHNKVKEWLNNFWYAPLFIFFSVIILSFLIKDRGVWLFADVSYTPIYNEKIYETFISTFSVFNNNLFYLGLDNSDDSFTRIPVAFIRLIIVYIFGGDIGQIFYYFIYFLSSYFFGLKFISLFSNKFTKPSLHIAALFITFNPFSLLLMSQGSMVFIYPFSMALIWSFDKYINKGQPKYLFTFLISVFITTGYHRLIPIIFIMWLFYLFLIFPNIKINLKRFFVLVFLTFLLTLPLTLNIAVDFFRKDNRLTNYVNHFSTMENVNYNYKSSTLNLLSYPGGFTPSSLSYFYNPTGKTQKKEIDYEKKHEFYKIVQFIFTFSILISSIYILRDKIGTKLNLLLGVILVINGIGLFVSLKSFIYIHKKILPFLYNDYGFIQLIQSIFLGLLIALLINKVAAHRNKSIAFTLLFLFINLTPLFSNHYGFRKFDHKDDLPPSYVNFFFQKHEGIREAAIFSPSWWVKFTWTPYLFDVNGTGDSNFKSLMIPNVRLFNKEALDFYNNITHRFNHPNFTNLFVFNVKNFIVFKDVVNTPRNIDNYGQGDLESKARNNYLTLKNNSNLEVFEDNENYAHFKFNNENDYDFFLYNPRKLYIANLPSFYEQNFEISKLPVVIDKNHSSNINLPSYELAAQNPVNIAYKYAANYDVKYLVKISNYKEGLPILLQFNQRFSDNWKLYFVPKNIWDSERCVYPEQYFINTQNSRCAYSYNIQNLLNFKDFKFYSNTYLSPQNHISGNILGNLYLIDPTIIPKEYVNGNEFYLVLYYEKQYLHITTVAISLFTLLAVGIFTIISFFLSLYKIRHNQKAL